ncbi:hypothetical protein OAB00_01870 [Akkermansiaceae bacterium]|nr:hypothetical protein [Akkermansiaceae bacterium]
MKIHSPPTKINAGFALIATIAIVSLLVIVALGMLNLSSTTTKTAKRSDALEEARANARLSLTTAISHLQRTVGPDTRVTASADILEGQTSAAGVSLSGVRPLTGVWRSWEGTNHDVSNGLPIVPTYANKLIDGDQQDPTVTGRFLGWLISGDGQDAGIDSPPSLTKTGNTVKLLSTGTIGTGLASDEVHLEPVSIDGGGSYAYWIQGENTKANLKRENQVTPSTDAEWSRNLNSNGHADLETFGFNVASEYDKGLTLPTLELMSNGGGTEPAKNNYHDITTYSNGLLTNTATGGWRKDLSLMGEKWKNGDISASGFPVFTPEPDVADLTSSLMLASSASSGSIYPWATVDKVSMSWNALLDFTTLYREIELSAVNGEPTIDYRPNFTSDYVSIMPILARAHWAFGYGAELTSGGSYSPTVVAKPMLTLWNPYNIAINTTGKYGIHHGLLHMRSNAFPIDFFAQVGTQPEVKLNIGKVFARRQRVNMARLTHTPSEGEMIFRPGASRVYGKDRISTKERSLNVIYTDPGYSTLGSLFNYVSDSLHDDETNTIANGAALDSYKFRWEYRDASSGILQGTAGNFWNRAGTGPDGVNSSGNAGNSRLYYPIDYTTSAGVTENVIAEKLPLPALVNGDETLSSAQRDDSPFVVITYGLRTFRNEENLVPPAVTPSTPPTDLDTKPYTKGYFNNNPIRPATSESGNTTPEHSSYVWEVFAPNAWSDGVMPHSDPAARGSSIDHGGYLGASFQPTYGLDRWIIAECPTQPLLSLGELQHFDISYNNEYAPRTLNAIGNSHASCFIYPDAILLDRGEASGTQKGFDHSYVSNHILFDDWFFSSITPEFEDFNPINELRSIEQVYAEHLSGVTPLRNNQYQPAKTIPQASALALATTELTDVDVWQNIASKMEVQGMFNINSTSKEAWKALLMNQRDAKVPTAIVGNSSPTDWSTDIETPTGIAFSRTSIAGDKDATGTAAYSSVVTYMSMSEAEIDALATEIVNQVKRRGPFLSLSEFVNRKLTADPAEVDLAMAGAIEAALIELSNSVNDPYDDIKATYPQQSNLPVDAESIYKFEEAAVGSAVYGTPGWTRQADVLRPLAPVLTARDDTFKIRAYGSSTDPNTGEIVKAWCEAIVKRTADYVDPTDESTKRVGLSVTNKLYGRKFEIVSFKWLNETEV